MILRALFGMVASRLLGGGLLGRAAGLAAGGGLTALAGTLFSGSSGDTAPDNGNWLENNAAWLGLAAGVLGFMSGKGAMSILGLTLASYAAARFSGPLLDALGPEAAQRTQTPAPAPVMAPR